MFEMTRDVEYAKGLSEEVVCRCTSRLLYGDTTARLAGVGSRVLFNASLKIRPRDVKLCTASAIFLASTAAVGGDGYRGGNRVGGAVRTSSCSWKAMSVLDGISASSRFCSSCSCSVLV